MKKANQDYTLIELCRLFKIKSSSYYYQQQEKRVDPEDVRIKIAIKAVAIDTGITYGKRRMHKVLQQQRFQLGLYKTASLMKKANVVAIHRCSGLISYYINKI